MKRKIYEIIKQKNKSKKNCSSDDRGFEDFLFSFFSTQKDFIVECPGKKFPQVDLVIYNLNKAILNYDIILVESKNVKNLEHQEINDFMEDIKNLGEFNILGIFCKTGDFPNAHFNEIYKSEYPILVFDEKTFNYFFETDISIGELINEKIIDYFDKKREYINKIRTIPQTINSNRDF